MIKMKTRGLLSALLLALATGACAGDAGSDAPALDGNALENPDSEAMNQKAPDVFLATFATLKGDFVLEVHRDWAPKGADRFYNLVRNGFYDDVRFFRVIPGFMVQFGIHGDPEIGKFWREARIEDDPVTQSNKRGFVSFAMSGPDSRTTQIFINFGDNTNLDGMGFAPFAEVIDGMDIVSQLYSAYGDGAPRGPGPEQGRIHSEGNEYLDAEFPFMDKVAKTAVAGG